MGKLIYPYLGFSTNDIVGRSSNTGDYIDGTTVIDVSNITIAKAKNVLGASTNKLTELCGHANVDKWSNFGPITWAIIGSVDGYPIYGIDFKSNISGVFKLGDFAAYNHNAVEPVTEVDGQSITFAVARTNVGSSNYNFIWAINLGEVDFSELNITHFAIANSINAGSWDNVTDISSYGGGDVENTYQMEIPNGDSSKVETKYLMFGHLVLDSFEPLLMLPNNSFELSAYGYYTAHIKVYVSSSLNGTFSTTGMQPPDSSEHYLEYIDATYGYAQMYGTFNHSSGATLKVRAKTESGTILGEFYNEANLDNVVDVNIATTLAGTNFLGWLQLDAAPYIPLDVGDDNNEFVIWITP